MTLLFGHIFRSNMRNKLILNMTSIYMIGSFIGCVSMSLRSHCRNILQKIEIVIFSHCPGFYHRIRTASLVTSYGKAVVGRKPARVERNKARTRWKGARARQNQAKSRTERYNRRMARSSITRKKGQGGTERRQITYKET